jgi:tetratricopeptide (TPR) repeat protein
LFATGCGQENKANKGEPRGRVDAPQQPEHTKPPPEPTHLERGNDYAAKKEYDKAIAEYSKAITECSKARDRVGMPALTGNNDGYNQRQMQKYNARIEEANLKLNDAKIRRADAYRRRGEDYAAKKDYAHAIEDFGAAVRDDPKNADAYKTLASDAYRRRGEDNAAKKDYDHAIEDFSAAIGEDPKNADAYKAIAWLRATCPKGDLRNGDKAIEYARKACQLSGWEDPKRLGTIAPGWKDAGKLETLAAAYAEEGDFKQAVKWQKKAVELGYDAKEQTEKSKVRLKLYEEGKPYRDE